VLPTKDEPRWIQDETRFKEALTAAGYEVEILFSQGSSAKEKANVEALITKGIQVLIICPQDGTAAAAAAEEARAAGVKVISYDRLIRDTDAVDYYVTFDSIAVGAPRPSTWSTTPPAPATRSTCTPALLPTTTPSCSSKAPGTCCSPRSPMAPS
jgi:ABC-type xylose transport system substrate-binding protein